MSKKDTEKTADGYEVGYGKPPKKHQFQLGTSGNKKGRPKGSKNIATLVTNAAHKKVKIQSGGKTKKVSQVEASVEQLFNKAAKGDLKAFEKAMVLYGQHGPVAPPHIDQKQHKQNVRVLNAMIEKLQNQGGMSDET